MVNLDFVKKSLPWIGSAAAAFATGGPAGLLVAVAKGIGSIVGKNVAPTADSIAAAVAGASPEQLLEMKKLDNDYALQLQQLGYQNAEEIAAIAEKDRESARNREVQVKDRTPKILAAVIIVACIVVESYVTFAVFHHQTFDTQGAVIIGRILGMLDTSVGLVLAYYFGSSAGSAAKTELMATQAANGKP